MIHIKLLDYPDSKLYSRVETSDVRLPVCELQSLHNRSSLCEKTVYGVFCSEQQDLTDLKLFYVNRTHAVVATRKHK